MGIKIISSNRKAFHEYHISDKFEAGLELCGTEVKSLREGRVNMTDGWVDLTDRGEAYLNDVHISKYSHGTHENHEEQRARRLLLHRKEIDQLGEAVGEKGMTIVPLKIYFKSSRIKVEIGMGRGKKLHDKRESAKKKEAQRDIDRAMRHS